jgi:hypothetical protein
MLHNGCCGLYKINEVQFSKMEKIDKRRYFGLRKMAYYTHFKTLLNSSDYINCKYPFLIIQNISFWQGLPRLSQIRHRDLFQPLSANQLPGYRQGCSVLLQPSKQPG